MAGGDKQNLSELKHCFKCYQSCGNYRLVALKQELVFQTEEVQYVNSGYRYKFYSCVNPCKQTVAIYKGSLPNWSYKYQIVGYYAISDGSY